MGQETNPPGLSDELLAEGASPPNTPETTVIILDRKLPLSLPQLFWLEQEMCSLPGLEETRVSVLEDGKIAVGIWSRHEQQAREFLMLSGYLSEGAQ